MTKYIYVETDHHGNNVWGLMQPRTLIENVAPDGELYYENVALNPEQELILEIHKQSLKGAKKITKGKPVTYLFLGDIVQGFKHPTTTVSTSPYAQQCIASANIDAVFKALNINKARFLFGTEAHDGLHHDSTRSIKAHAMEQVTDTRMLKHGVITVDGLSIDYAHHGSGMGRRDWLRGNEMRYYTKSIMARELKRGKKPPDIILRGHFHGFHWETVRERINNQWYTTECILVPSFCGLGAYGQQVTRSEYMISNGALLFEIDKGQFRLHDWVLERDLRTKEVL